MPAFDSSKKTEQSSTSSSQTNPWAPQAGALSDAFADAQKAYGQSSGAQAPTDFTAQMLPEQLATFRSMIAQGGNSAIPNANAAAGTALTGAGASGTTSAIDKLNTYDPSAANNPDALVDSANKYVAGQDIDAQVRNAMLNATQTARDVTMPGIEQNAAIGGNTNSSRTGIANGLVERGLAQQSTDLGASLRSTAFQNGLTLAQQQASNNNNAALTAATNQGALSTNAVNSGVNANSAAVSAQGILNNTAVQGGAGLQAADQAKLTNEQQKYQSLVSSPYDSLEELMKIIGSANWGSSTNSTTNGTSTTTNSPSLISNIGAVAGGLVRL